MSQEYIAEIPVPIQSEGNNYNLSSESQLSELPLYSFHVETSCTGLDMAKVFEKYPLLPGVILLEGGNYFGMLSRRQLLEFFIRPYGKELFVQQPLHILYSYARTGVLVLGDTTPILTGMQLAMRRSPECLAEPIVVDCGCDTYKLLDIQELHRASWQIRGIETQVRYERSQAQIIQSDKMASLGRLVDGVAHEILDPVNFIWGNLTHVSSYCQDILRLVNAYERELPQPSANLKNFKQEIEYEFLEEDLLKSLASIQSGAERLKKLVTSLQNFCHIDEVYPKPADLHACLDSIILLINSRINGEIEIVKNYGHLPPVYCFLGQLNQVFMNIFSRVIDTLLDDAVRQELSQDAANTLKKARIQVITEVVGSNHAKPGYSRWVSVKIIDNSNGMSAAELTQIVESFSLEKRADKETSLAVSYRIITARHGGKFNLRSQLGIGTEFEILLPLV